MANETPDRAVSRGRVSVIIPVGRIDHERLKRQLDQLGRQSTPRDFEVVVCDNDGGYQHDTNQSLLDVTVVDASAVRGSSYARNTGVSAAIGDRLLFCDADDLVGPNWVEAHAAALDDATFSVGSILTVDESDERVGLATRGDWPHAGFSTSFMKHEGVAVGSSCNLAVRRAALERAGRFPLAYLRSQDVALSLALDASGVTPQFTPDAEVMYIVGTRSRRRELRNRYETGIARVRLHADFHVGPGPLTLTWRAFGRTVRAVCRRSIRRSHGRPPSSEAAEFIGCLMEAGWRPIRRRAASLSRAHAKVS